MVANNPLVFSHMRFILRKCDRPEKVWKNVANFKMPATSSSITKLAADGLGRHRTLSAVRQGDEILRPSVRPHVARVCRQFLDNDFPQT